MQRLALLATLAFLAIAGAQAQPVTNPAPVGDAGAYNSVAPTCIDAQFCLLQVDANGNLKVVASGTPSGTQDVNVLQWGSVALGAMANYGTSPGAVKVPGVNAFITNTVTVTGTGGTFPVTQSTSPWVVAGSGTAGTANAGVVTVQGIASMTPVQVSQATAASLNATVVGTGTFAAQAQPTPVTSGGLSSYFVQPAASDNHANIKNGAGQIYHVSVTNNSATINYIRFYNAASGFNGCGSATNLVYQLAVPASTSGAGFVQDIAQGIAFSTGISICVTSAYATTDTTNATASAMSVFVGYK